MWMSSESSRGSGFLHILMVNNHPTPSYCFSVHTKINIKATDENSHYIMYSYGKQL